MTSMALILGAPETVPARYKDRRFYRWNPNITLMRTTPGENRAIGQMRRICEAKGATVCGTGVVNWSRKRREQQIAEVVDRLGRLF
jgi:uncharacterized protein (UPF0261 family)